MPSVYFCHHCNRTVNLRHTDLLCGTCGSDFIEEMENPFLLPSQMAPPEFPFPIPPHLHAHVPLGFMPPRVERAAQNPSAVRNPGRIPPAAQITGRNPSAPPRRSRSFPRTSRLAREDAYRRHIRRTHYIILLPHNTVENESQLQRSGPESANQPQPGAGGPPPAAPEPPQPSIIQHLYDIVGLHRFAGQQHQQETAQQNIPHQNPPHQNAPQQEAGVQQRPEPTGMPHVHFRFGGPVPPNAEGADPNGAGPQLLNQLLAGVIGATPQGIRIELRVDPEGAQRPNFQPGDFAINGMDMDQILNNLMMQFGDGAHPPENLTDQEIARIPMVKVDQTHVDNNTQCSTCFDYFSLDEDVARLNCNHIFHLDCVKPWLLTHNTCPMCRALVNPTEWPTTGAQAHPEQAEPTRPQQARPSTRDQAGPAPQRSTTGAPPGMVDTDELD